MDQLHVAIILAASLIISRSFALGIFEEPVCSKYHFEEKVLEKLITLEIKVENELKRLQKKVSVMDATGASIKSAVAALMGNVSKIESKQDAITSDHDIVTKEKDGLPKFNTIIAFTATTPKRALANNIPVFDNIVTNVGGAFEQKTGRFVCPVSGVYLFSVTLRTDRNHVNCWIRKNDKNILYAQTTSSETTATSTAIATLELSVGDTVNLGQCYNWKDIFANAGTTFSGILVSF